MKLPSEDGPRRLLGGLLRQARAEAGLTQDAIGHAVSVERTGVTRMEGGERLPSHAALGAWLDLCGVTGLAESGIRAMWRAARRHDYDDEPLKAWFVGWVDAEKRRAPAPVLEPAARARNRADAQVRLRGLPRRWPFARAGDGGRGRAH